MTAPVVPLPTEAPGGGRRAPGTEPPASEPPGSERPGSDRTAGGEAPVPGRDGHPPDRRAAAPDPGSVLGRARARLAALDARLADAQLPLVLTLVLVMLATSRSWYVAVPAVILAVVGLAVPAALRSWGLWLALAGVLGAAAWAARWQVDNHQFLIAYWCLALGVAARSPDPAQVRRWSARLLIGAVFVLATMWKLLSPDFVDGSFMRFTLLTDERFAEVAALVGDIDPADLDANRQAMTALAEPDRPLTATPLTGSHRLDVVATAVTWWTLAIEGAVALTFLSPWRRLARHRDLTLIAFVATTYAVAPVVGFGWVLVCLGLAQHEPGRRWVRLGYFGAFLLVQAYVAPWTSVAGLMP